MSALEKEWMISFDPQKCTQCHGCEIACKTWRNLPYGVHYRRVLNLWNGEYPQIKNGSLSLSCLHCVDPACVENCPEEALSKNKRTGRVEVNEDRCTGCETCADACIYGVPQFTNHIMQKCDLCFEQSLGDAEPPCVETCPGTALALVEVTQAEKESYENKVERIMTPIRTMN